MDGGNLPWAHTANCFSSASRRSRWWCRNPNQQRSCCKSSGSDPHPGPGSAWIPWPTLENHLNQTLTCATGGFAISATFSRSKWDWGTDRPEWPGDTPAPDCRWRSGRWFCRLCSSRRRDRSAPGSPAGWDQKTSEKKDVCFLLFWLRRKKKKAHPTRQQVCNVLMEDDQTATSTAGIHAAHASYSERLKPLGFFFVKINITARSLLKVLIGLERYSAVSRRGKKIKESLQEH